MLLVAQMSHAHKLCKVDLPCRSITISFLRGLSVPLAVSFYAFCKRCHSCPGKRNQLKRPGKSTKQTDSKCLGSQYNSSFRHSPKPVCLLLFQRASTGTTSNTPPKAIFPRGARQGPTLQLAPQVLGMLSCTFALRVQGPQRRGI